MLSAARRTLFALITLLSLTTGAVAQNPFRSFDNSPVIAFPEAHDREDVFASQRWGDLVKSFDEWVSVQLIYTESQVAELVQGIKTKIESLELAELKAFVVDTEERLAVLLSDEAAAVRRYLSVTNAEYRQKLLARDGLMPNVFAVPVTQLRQDLLAFQQQRLAAAMASSEFNAARQQRVESLHESNLAQQQAIRAAHSNAARSAQAGRTNTRTQQFTPRTQPRRNSSPQYVVSAFGGISRVLP